jgi:hypothetical protein
VKILGFSPSPLRGEGRDEGDFNNFYPSPCLKKVWNGSFFLGREKFDGLLKSKDVLGALGG